jgi:selenocysteine-specific elongation factor
VKDFNVTGQDDVNILFSRIEDMYRQYGLQPDTPAAGAEGLKVDKKKFQEVLDSLTRSGRLVRICTDHYLHPEHLERVRAALEEFFAHHDLLTPPDVRELFDISRKYIIPLLEYFDGIKFTVRTPEGRKKFIGGRSR